MKRTHLLALALSALSALPIPTFASTIGCPDLALASQVGTCPSEEELRYTFSGYCSDDGKAYRGETDVCTDYQRYKALKNVALWESGDGRFDAYVSCAQPPAAIRAGQAQNMQLFTQGKINRLVCSYPNGLNFAYRTRAQCVVESAVCSAGGKDCRARCDE